MLESLLIVDDAEFLRYSLRDLLHGEGIATVAEAGSRHEARSLGRALKPDAVLVDLSVSPAEGLDLLHEMTTLLPQARFVAVVLDGDRDTASAADRLGAEFTLDRPYDPGDVRDLLRQLRAAPVVA